MATAENARRLKAIRSVRQVFDALGGGRAIAQMTGCKLRTVLNWRHLYGRLPAKTYLLLQSELKKRGCIGDPKLWRML